MVTFLCLCLPGMCVICWCVGAGGEVLLHHRSFQKLLARVLGQILYFLYLSDDF